MHNTAAMSLPSPVNQHCVSNIDRDCNLTLFFTLHSYLSLLKEQSRYPTECNIIALIYTNRMTSMGSMPLTMLNWRAIWAVSVILAQKMWDDTPLKTSAFVHILPSFSKQLLRHLELSALTILQFSTGTFLDSIRFNSI
jgi:hypothetical protein